MLATTAPTDLPRWRESWYVSYPMIIVSFMGILTAQGSPPQLAVHLNGDLGGHGHQTLGFVQNCAR